jgi:hypothetical protein
VGYSSSFYASTRPENKDFGVLGNELVSLTRIGIGSSTYEIKTLPKIYKMAIVLLTTEMFFLFYAYMNLMPSQPHFHTFENIFCKTKENKIELL